MASDAGTEAAPAPQAATSRTKTKELYPMVNWKYDLFQWIMSILVDLFFREVHPRGCWKVPKSGPVLFVAAPHANQFVDGIVLQRILRQESGRRVSQLIAQKSVHGIVGWLSRQVGALPVGRAQDAAKPGSGMIYLPDPVRDPTLVRGVDTKFGEGEAEVGGMVFLPSGKKQTGASVDIADIISAEEIRIKRPFKGKLAMEQLTGRTDLDEDGNFLNKDVKGCQEGFKGTKYKLAPHIDQTKVYEAVFARIRSGGCVGLFPEGGSHDRTELLPLKAGVAIMALGALAEAPDCELKIVPVGMNYFHAHKFRSRAVVEFGNAFDVPADLVQKYKNNERRDAIGQLLDMVYQSLGSVVVSTPDYDTLMLIQAARRLYNPTGSGKKMPLPVVVELNRRLAMGYERYKDDPRIVKILAAVKDYNLQLRYLNLRDHQVQHARTKLYLVVFLLLKRITLLTFLALAVLPGLILFSPVFIATKVISIKKAKEALAGSTVKIQGRDVMATWKLLVSIVFAPTLYHIYSTILTLKAYQDGIWGYVPQWVPLVVVYFGAWPFMIAITVAALRFGEVGMDVFKSLRPLVMCLDPSSSYHITQLRAKRVELSEQVTELINTLGPEMFPGEFERFLRTERAREAREAAEKGEAVDPGSLVRPEPEPETEIDSPPQLSRRSTMQSSRALPRNDSFSNIGGITIFSTQPPSRSSRSTSRSRSRSRSRSGSHGAAAASGFSIGGFTTLDAAGGYDEAQRRIRSAMKVRRFKSADSEDEEDCSDEEGYNEARQKNE